MLVIRSKTVNCIHPILHRCSNCVACKSVNGGNRPDLPKILPKIGTLNNTTWQQRLCPHAIAHVKHLLGSFDHGNAKRMRWFGNCLYFSSFALYSTQHSSHDSMARFNSTMQRANWKIWKRLEIDELALKNETISSSFNDYMLTKANTYQPIDNDDIILMASYAQMHSIHKIW